MEKYFPDYGTTDNSVPKQNFKEQKLMMERGLFHGQTMKEYMGTLRRQKEEYMAINDHDLVEKVNKLFTKQNEWEKVIEDEMKILPQEEVSEMMYIPKKKVGKGYKTHKQCHFIGTVGMSM